jgi:hypothetical protein
MARPWTERGVGMGRHPGRLAASDTQSSRYVGLPPIKRVSQAPFCFLDGGPGEDDQPENRQRGLRAPKELNDIARPTRWFGGTGQPLRNCRLFHRT